MTFEPNAPQTREEVEETVTDTIQNDEVVLFMKGTELMPQCGYSRTALNLLQRYCDDITVVNVLDGTVEMYRDALEEHSGWTTIPQAFVDGEFIGGADILTELNERGELSETLGEEPTEVPF